jgi:hypothetical protein
MDCRNNANAAATGDTFENVDRKHPVHQFSPRVVPGGSIAAVGGRNIMPQEGDQLFQPICLTAGRGRETRRLWRWHDVGASI